MSWARKDDSSAGDDGSALGVDCVIVQLNEREFEPELAGFIQFRIQFQSLCLMEYISCTSDEVRREWCLSKGINPDEHCCLDMAWFISDSTDFPSQGINQVIMYIDSWREYRIHITRMGSSSTVILYCPWCGNKLPERLTEEWYQTLYCMGHSDPGEETIPEEFDTSEWWKKRGF
jgi:hypothetical protein